jgi:hypothetical protein
MATGKGRHAVEPDRPLERLTRSSPLLAALLSVSILAMGLGGVNMLPGGPLPAVLQQWVGELAISGRLVVPDLSEALDFLIIFSLWVALPISVLYLLISRESRRHFLRTLRTMIGVLTLLILIRAARRQGMFLGESAAATGGLGVSGLMPPTFVTDPPRWVGIVISLVLSVLLISVAWWFIRRVGRPATATSEELSQVADEALNRLAHGDELKGVIIRCYAEMIGVVRGRWSVRRRPAMTPREFKHSLVEAGLPAHEVGRLTWLFEEVRYGARVFGEREETEAVACLRAIVESSGEKA